MFDRLINEAQTVMYEFEVTELMLYGGPMFIILLLLEVAFSLKYEPELYKWKDLAASGTMGVGAAILAGGAKVWSLAIFAVAYILFNPMDEMGIRHNIMGGWETFGLTTWYVWLICQFLDDFAYYLVHRANHEIRVLWAAHIVHHSSDHFNLGTAVRNGWVTLFYKPFFYMWICALGFHPIMLMTCLAIESFWQYQLHLQWMPRLGPLEKIFNLHKHHEVHHSSDLDYLDKNHGGYLIIFDRLFGTFKDKDDSKPVNYGVLHPPNSYNPMTILTHEYVNIWNDVKKAKTWKGRFMYIFGPPGWSEDGSTLTVKQMQRQQNSNASHQKSVKTQAA